MSKPGVVSYAHLNELIIQILRDSGRDMTAQEIANYIEEHYKTKKVLVKSLSVAKRMQGHPNVSRVKQKRGYFLYRYVE
jgi:hypothetical protein